MKSAKAFLFSALLLLGCNEEPVAISSTSNPAVPVALLFEHDGCKVYRFIDGNFHYFTKCVGAQATTEASHTENCGKGCTKTVTEEIPTVTVKP